MINLFFEGEPIHMYPLLFLLAASIFLIIRGIKNNSTKNLNLLKSIGLFALVYGFLVFTMELISLFEMIPKANNVSTGVLAVGLRIEILPPTFGMFIFLVGRAGMISLLMKKK